MFNSIDFANVAAAARLASLTVADVASVYSGRAGKCACGCAGTHFYASAHVDSASARRGYPVSIDEVNDAMVARVVSSMKKNAATADACSDDTIAVEVGKRLYIVHLAPPAVARECPECHNGPMDGDVCPDCNCEPPPGC